jgi:hypothetical protein
VARVCVEPQGKSVTPLVHSIQQSTKTFVPPHSADVPRRLAGNQFAPGIRWHVDLPRSSKWNDRLIGYAEWRELARRTPEFRGRAPQGV